MPPRKRGPLHRVQIAPRVRVPSAREMGPLCLCGDAAGWHTLVDGEFVGKCLYRPCGCLQMRLPEVPDDVA